MHQHLAPLAKEPVSVHAPDITYPDGHYRHEDPVVRHATRLKPLRGLWSGRSLTSAFCTGAPGGRCLPRRQWCPCCGASAAPAGKTTRTGVGPDDCSPS
jgi:hypothetical protein